VSRNSKDRSLVGASPVNDRLLGSCSGAGSSVNLYLLWFDNPVISIGQQARHDLVLAIGPSDL
jgi:hypothetical protein